MIGSDVAGLTQRCSFIEQAHDSILLAFCLPLTLSLLCFRFPLAYLFLKLSLSFSALFVCLNTRVSVLQLAGHDHLDGDVCKLLLDLVGFVILPDDPLPFAMAACRCTAGSISSIRINRRYQSGDAPPNLVAGKRNTSRLSILITVSRPAECACLMRRNPVSVRSINQSSWTTKSRPGWRTSRSMGDEAASRE